jgi:hypothetical protein
MILDKIMNTKLIMRSKSKFSSSKHKQLLITQLIDLYLTLRFH